MIFAVTLESRIFNDKYKMSNKFLRNKVMSYIWVNGKVELKKIHNKNNRIRVKIKYSAKVEILSKR